MEQRPRKQQKESEKRCVQGHGWGRGIAQHRMEMWPMGLKEQAQSGRAIGPRASSGGRRGVKRRGENTLKKKSGSENYYIVIFHK